MSLPCLGSRQGPKQTLGLIQWKWIRHSLAAYVAHADAYSTFSQHFTYTQVPIAQSGARNPKMAKNSLLKKEQTLKQNSQQQSSE
jgi:hypothetical protein